jgi:hypothetical protein
MNTQLSDRWWEAAVAVSAISSVVLGVVAVGNGHVEWAIATGFTPAALLVGGIGLRTQWRTSATVAVTIGSIAAASWWWMIYPVFLAAVVIMGGLASGKIGTTRLGAHPAQ